MYDALGIAPEFGRSREGAWIEIVDDAPYRRPDYGRSREGAWIEISDTSQSNTALSSLPRGSVD